MNAIAMKLKEIRDAAGLSQKDFGKKLDLGPVTMNRLEKGNQLPDANVLIRLRALFGTDLNWLLTDDSSPGHIVGPSKSVPVYDDEQLIKPEDQRHSISSLQVPGAEQAVFAVRVKDESMFPKLRIGDYVLIDMESPKLGDLCLTQTEIGHTQVRYVSRLNDTLTLTSENEDAGSPKRFEDTVLLGRVCQIVRLYDV